jgi:peptidoglycan hydrolase CwlO-like protein
MKQQYWIAIAAGVILALTITSAVFFYRLGVLKEKNKILNLTIAKEQAAISILNNEITARNARIKVLDGKIQELQPQVVELVEQVEQREVQILKAKNYGQKTIDRYLDMDVEQRKREFSKLIK